MAAPRAPLRLQLMERPGERVYCAVADKETTDFLLGLVHITLGGLATMRPEANQGSFGNLLRSLGSLEEAGQLNPGVAANISRINIQAPPSVSQTLPGIESQELYICWCCNKNAAKKIGTSTPVAAALYTMCAECRSPMSHRLTPFPAATEGFVKEGQYIVRDDLRIKTLDIADIVAVCGGQNGIVPRNVDIGGPEAVELIWNVLRSDTVLSDTFIPNAARACKRRAKEEPRA